jgi:hypothetical protein
MHVSSGLGGGLGAASEPPVEERVGEHAVRVEVEGKISEVGSCPIGIVTFLTSDTDGSNDLGNGHRGRLRGAVVSYSAAFAGIGWQDAATPVPHLL